MLSESRMLFWVWRIDKELRCWVDGNDLGFKIGREIWQADGEETQCAGGVLVEKELRSKPDPKNPSIIAIDAFSKSGLNSWESSGAVRYAQDARLRQAQSQGPIGFAGPG